MMRRRCEWCSAENLQALAVHALILTILDTGCRITELLTASVNDFDFDNPLLTVYGKGRKERRVRYLRGLLSLLKPGLRIRGDELLIFGW